MAICQALLGTPINAAWFNNLPHQGGGVEPVSRPLDDDPASAQQVQPARDVNPQGLDAIARNGVQVEVVQLRGKDAVRFVRR